jgi:predicted metal-dependent HD superfamily phosphohydrolase
MKFRKIANLILSKYIKDNESLNSEVEKLFNMYTNIDRYYHNVKHIEDLYNKATSFKTTINNMESFGLAILFHDCILDVNNTSRDVENSNEGLSAKYCSELLKKYNAHPKLIDRVKKMILATISHTSTEDPDTNLFIDLDLSSLANDYKSYEVYSANIYLEYQKATSFTEETYRTGRIKFLNSMIKRNKIFLTRQYRHLENTAKDNMGRELTELQKHI